MKIAISGKGGVGKTLLASQLARVFAESGYSVIAIDADPDANLAASLGFPHPDKIVPISEMSDLIEERTGSKPGETSPYFRINPRVDDIPEKYAAQHDRIRLMVMGRVKKGGAGCYCPESALLRTLLAHLLLARDEVVILDMEAGIEHLGRGTAKAVDRLVVVVEPGRRSIETAHQVDRLAREIGIANVAVVGNKIRNPSDKEFIISLLGDYAFLGFIPYDTAVIDADLANLPVVEASNQVVSAVKMIQQELLNDIKS